MKVRYLSELFRKKWESRADRLGIQFLPLEVPWASHSLGILAYREHIKRENRRMKEERINKMLFLSASLGDK